MKSYTLEEIRLVILIGQLIASIPGLWPLFHWIRRWSGDPAMILTEMPALPWWAKGFFGQFLVVLTLSFWIGVAARLLLAIGESVPGSELADQWSGPISSGATIAAITLTVQLYQRAAAIALPPHFNWAEKKALRNLEPLDYDLEEAAAYYQPETADSATIP